MIAWDILIDQLSNPFVGEPASMFGPKKTIYLYVNLVFWFQYNCLFRSLPPSLAISLLDKRFFLQFLYAPPSLTFVTKLKKKYFCEEPPFLPI